MREFPAGWRVVAVETFELEAGEPPYDIALAVRVGALDGRHQDAEAPAKRRIAAALTPHGRLFIDGGYDIACHRVIWRMMTGRLCRHQPPPHERSDVRARSPGSPSCDEPISVWFPR